MLFGYRDSDRWYQTEMLAVGGESMRGIGLEQARMQDIDRAFARGLEDLLTAASADADGATDSVPQAGKAIDGFWIHLDVDVLDDALMCAVDAREPDGLTADELTRLLRHALASGRCLGMHVTNYDPERDPGLDCGRALVALLVAALRDDAKVEVPDDPERTQQSV